MDEKILVIQGLVWALCTGYFTAIWGKSGFIGSIFGILFYVFFIKNV